MEANGTFCQSLSLIVTTVESGEHLKDSGRRQSVSKSINEYQRLCRTALGTPCLVVNHSQTQMCYLFPV